MKEKIAIGVSALIVLIVTVIFLRGPRAMKAPETSLAPGTEDLRAEPPTRALRGSPIDSSIDSSGDSSGDLTPPDMGALQDDIERDPHSTPESILRFAHELSEPMETALQSPANAEKFFPRLRQCTLGDTVNSPLPIRAICFANAKELAEKFPDNIRTAYEALAREASPEVVQLANSLN